MRRIMTATALCAGVLPIMPAATQAAVLPATGITTTVLVDSNDTTSPYTDDVFLDTLSFGTTVFSGGGNFRAIDRFLVTGGASRINAEWGDNDDNANGDDNPFAKAGLDPADQETVDPTIQNAALLQAFNSRNLSEMSDGEGGGDFSFRVEFSASLTDNDDAVDDVPEIVFFERGLNDPFSVRLIIGGSFDTPVYSNSVSMNSNSFWATDIRVDTTETTAQEIGVGGFDFNDFGIASGTSVYGFELNTSNSGPDLNGFFLTATDESRFGTPLSYVAPATVPLPAGLPLMLAGLAGLAAMRTRRG